MLQFHRFCLNDPAFLTQTKEATDLLELVFLATQNNFVKLSWTTFSVSRQFDDFFWKHKFDSLQFQVFFLIRKQTKGSNGKTSRNWFSELQRFLKIRKASLTWCNFTVFWKVNLFFGKVNKQKEATAKLWGIGFLGPQRV